MTQAPPFSETAPFSRRRLLRSLARRALRRLLLLCCVFLGITVISFAVIHLAPGSPVDLETTMNPLADQDARARLQALYGLDRPLYVQYGDWLRSLVQLDFGNSLSGDRRPVLSLIAERLPLTVGMNAASLLLTLLIAIPLGCLSARHRGSPFDFGVAVFVFIGFAMPGFWLALILIQHLAIDWRLFPISGLTSLNYATLSPWGKALDAARHLALPIAVYTIGSLAHMSRFMRSSMLEVLRQDYIVTARAKGLSARAVLFSHALRNALLPVITLLGLSIPGLIGGSVIIETIFALPGLGQLFYSAVMMRDYPLIMGNLVLGAFLTLAGNLIADICYGLADPRIRSGAETGTARGEGRENP
ncbi:MAG: ABC transporter permease [Deltaproteobacteria bacterium]|jgi:peptide/nickel transport system permease protein|nr:ABC transporter permease [Deltaproteobacteria bacterium]